MDEAIMALRIAVRDSERSVAAQWEEVERLEAEIAQLEQYRTAAQERYDASADWLDGIIEGLEALEAIAAADELSST